MNVHIDHPPEATVQIHQVARVKSDSEQSDENSVETVLIPQLPTGPQYNDNANNSINSVAASGKQQQRPQGLLGMCFPETVHGKVKSILFTVFFLHIYIVLFTYCQDCG